MGYLQILFQHQAGEFKMECFPVIVDFMYKSIYLSDRFSFYRCDFAELTSKQTFTYSKSTIKTLEKGVKYVQG